MAVKKEKSPKLSEAMKGNKNAYVDDEKKVIDILTNMQNGLIDGTYNSLSKALLKNGIGHNSFRDYSEKYASNKTVSDIIKTVRELGEVVIESNSIDGLGSSASAIFHLKHHYGHSDQPKQDNSTKKIVIKVTGKKDV
jgi:hypothetical protein